MKKHVLTVSCISPTKRDLVSVLCWVNSKYTQSKRRGIVLVGSKCTIIFIKVDTHWTMATLKLCFTWEQQYETESKSCCSCDFLDRSNLVLWLIENSSPTGNCVTIIISLQETKSTICDLIFIFTSFWVMNGISFDRKENKFFFFNSNQHLLVKCQNY